MEPKSDLAQSLLIVAPLRSPLRPQLRLGLSLRLVAAIASLGSLVAWPGLALARPPLAPDTARALADLGSPEALTRHQAALALKRLGEPAVGLLRAALRSPQEQSGAILALGTLGSQAAAAVPDLVALLDEPQEAIRLDAAVALRRIGPAAGGALVAALASDRPFVRRGAAFALAGLNLPSAIPALMERLGDDDLATRANAAIALRALGDRAVPALLAALAGDEFRRREGAASILGQIDLIARDTHAVSTSATPRPNRPSTPRCQPQPPNRPQPPRPTPQPTRLVEKSRASMDESLIAFTPEATAKDTALNPLARPAEAEARRRQPSNRAGNRPTNHQRPDNRQRPYGSTIQPNPGNNRPGIPGNRPTTQRPGGSTVQPNPGNNRPGIPGNRPNQPRR